MTENEAKKLRCAGPCPENTGILHTQNDVNVTPLKVGLPAKGPYFCSGSKCMAWQAADYNNGIEVVHDGYCGHIK